MPLHATWLVSFYNHLTSCEGKRHIAKRKLALHWSVVNGKMQLPPEDPLRIVSLSPCAAVSSSFWSTPVFVLCTFTEHLKLRLKHWTVWYTLQRQYTQQAVMFCLVHKVLCRTVVSLQSCFEIYVLLICDKCPLLRINEKSRNLVRFFSNFFLQSQKLVLGKSGCRIFAKLVSAVCFAAVLAGTTAKGWFIIGQYCG